ncbi:hypothetical protein CJ010_24405 [Azoarcus sp. DD4]|uniref:hypothetical protein n=1 Tax=Azoarcus sp. DD4 TaxID=2027405 RepID=UPI00112A8B62|nr:hypothetical protein [Azoarcus sp. DD4]QDF99453.1 hypothetical protein CJ010_24405 [Azoarcus sp. DD4]
MTQLGELVAIGLIKELDNGVWLPGKLPVDGNGLNLWGSASTSLPDKDDVGRKKVVRGRGSDRWSYTPLSGPRAGNPGANAGGSVMTATLGTTLMAANIDTLRFVPADEWTF